jgi:hypothetical protein
MIMHHCHRRHSRAERNAHKIAGQGTPTLYRNYRGR